MVLLAIDSNLTAGIIKKATSMAFPGLPVIKNIDCRNFLRMIDFEGQKNLWVYRI
jgi:hypothetical protein